MYGVPEDIDLTPFVGASLNQVCLGVYQTAFHFQNSALEDAVISVEGLWEMRDQQGTIVTSRAHHDSAESDDLLRVDRLLGDSVSACLVSPPDWIELRFVSGLALRVHDDSDEYESFSVQPGDYFI